MSLREDLISIERDKYGDRYVDHVLEQYKLFVEMADKISERRNASNTFFLSLNTALLGIIGFIGAKGITSSSFLIGLLSMSGILICYAWYRIVRSYKDLNTAKFNVIHEIETLLPLRLYDAEWTSVGKGKNKKLYLPFTEIEMRIPWIYLIVYVVVLGTIIVKCFIST